MLMLLSTEIRIKFNMSHYHNILIVANCHKQVPKNLVMITVVFNFTKSPSFSDIHAHSNNYNAISLNYIHVYSNCQLNLYNMQQTRLCPQYTKCPSCTDYVLPDKLGIRGCGFLVAGFRQNSC